jgi:phage terminase small subunit
MPEPRVKAKGLTDKQAMFAREYLIDLNATQAAIRAGYSEKTAGWIGPQLLTKTHIAIAVQEAMNSRAGRIEITADRVLQEIAKLAFSNLQDFYDEDGGLKAIHTLPRDVAACLLTNKINLTEACAIQEIKLHDKKGSLELLGKHLRLFADRVPEDEEPPPPTRVVIEIKDARKVSE